VFLVIGDSYFYFLEKTLSAFGYCWILLNPNEYSHSRFDCIREITAGNSDFLTERVSLKKSRAYYLSVYYSSEKSVILHLSIMVGSKL
jgi:hypothetical protein